MSPPFESSRTTSDDRDLALVRAASGGDEAAFAALYESLLPRVYGFVRRRLGSHADAEDVTQEILIEVFRGLAAFRGDAPFSAWVFAIVRRVLARHWAGRRPGEPLGRASAVAARAPSPEDRAHARGVLRRIFDFLDRRHRGASQALELQLGQGLALREVARRLGRTPNALKASLRRARRSAASIAPEPSRARDTLPSFSR